MSLPILNADIKPPSIVSNIGQFEEDAREWLSNVPFLTKDSDDDDFKLAEDNVKYLKSFEDDIKKRQDEIISQCGDLYEILERTKSVSDMSRDKRLPLSRDVKSKKQEIKSFVLKTFRDMASDYIGGVKSRFRYQFQWPEFDFIPKNARSLKGYSKQLEDAFSDYKEDVDNHHDLIASRCKVFKDNVGEYEYLFSDAENLIGNCDSSILPDLIKSRISAHIAKQEEKAREEENKTPEPPLVETKVVEEVDTDTGEIIEVEQKIEMVTLDKSKLLELMKDVGNCLTSLGGDSKVIGRVDKLVRYLSK